MPKVYDQRLEHLHGQLEEKQSERYESWKEFAEDPASGIPEDVDCDEIHDMAARMQTAIDAEERDERYPTKATRSVLESQYKSSFGHDSAYDRSLRTTQTGQNHSYGTSGRVREKLFPTTHTEIPRKRKVRDPTPLTRFAHVNRAIMSDLNIPSQTFTTNSQAKAKLTEIMHNEKIEPNVRRLAGIDRWNMTFRQQLPEDAAVIPDFRRDSAIVNGTSANQNDHRMEDYTLSDAEDDGSYDESGAADGAHEDDDSEDEDMLDETESPKRRKSSAPRKSAPRSAHKTPPSSTRRVRFSESGETAPAANRAGRSQARRGRGRGNYVVVSGRRNTQALTRDDYYDGGRVKKKFVLKKE